MCYYLESEKGEEPNHLLFLLFNCNSKSLLFMCFIYLFSMDHFFFIIYLDFLVCNIYTKIVSETRLDNSSSFIFYYNV